MKKRLHWDVSAHQFDICVSAMAKGPGMLDISVATAEMCFINPMEYGVPPDVPRDKVYRFSRVKAQPKGKGGGSAVLQAALKILDEMGAWAVLEASPYPGQDAADLYAFYERHGFRHNEEMQGAMYRPPGGSRDGVKG